MTAEEAMEAIQRLASFNFRIRRERAAAKEYIEQLEAMGELPAEVSIAIVAAERQLLTRGGQVNFDMGEPSLWDHISFADALAAMQYMDQEQANRYVAALLVATQSGDPFSTDAVLAELAQAPNVPDDMRLKIEGAVEVFVTNEAQAATRGEMGPTTGADGGMPGTGDPLEMFDPEVLASFIGGGGAVQTHYGVPSETGEGVPFEAIVGDGTVAPQYPTGWSLQPQRFGLNNEESIARAQILMEDMGLLRPGEYLPGVWDIRTAGRNDTQGWRAVLAFANMTGQTWEESFSRLYDAGTDAAARGLQMELERLSRTPYFEDPEKLRDRTRRFLRSMGRTESQITDEELDQIMSMAARGSQQSMMGALTEQYERQATIGPQGDVALGALQGGGLPAAPMSDAPLDPIAHFDSALRNVMGREIESREAQEEAAGGAQRMARTAGMIGSARE